MEMELQERVMRCANLRTVVGTVASGSFAPALLSLAHTAEAVGFACTVVQPFHWFSELRHSALVPLPVPSSPLLPRSAWCTNMSALYGWRRSHLYRVRLWRVVLHLHIDLLAVDVDHELSGPPLVSTHGASSTLVELLHALAVLAFRFQKRAAMFAHL